MPDSFAAKIVGRCPPMMAMDDLDAFPPDQAAALAINRNFNNPSGGVT